MKGTLMNQAFEVADSDGGWKDVADPGRKACRRLARCRVMRSYRLIILFLFIQQAVALGPVGHMRVVVDNWDATFYPVLSVPITDKDAVTAAMVGALAPDAGYMVDRMEYFTDLAHYLRSRKL